MPGRHVIFNLNDSWGEEKRYHFPEKQPKTGHVLLMLIRTWKGEYKILTGTFVGLKNYPKYHLDETGHEYFTDDLLDTCGCAVFAFYGIRKDHLKHEAVYQPFLDCLNDKKSNKHKHNVEVLLWDYLT